VKGYRPSYKKEHTKAGNKLATANFPFLYEVVADPSPSIEVFLLKKPPTLQRPNLTRTQDPMPSSQKATPSFSLVSKPMSPPAVFHFPNHNLFLINEGYHVGDNLVPRVTCTL
nr:hypothetical protein [Tanacetum cinerariifolium]